MCGIVGYIGSGNIPLLTKMTDALVHRGPDESGYFIDDNQSLYLGHRRLSIIDPQTGQQPMWNSDKSICVIFNGEIYNHRELRKQLQTYGYRFGSDHSDTEVLIHGYHYWQEKLPEYLSGMFSFAIYDKKNNHLFLARDHFGKKPLYYTCPDQKFFGFSSELSSLHLHPNCPQEINELAIQKFLAYGFVPAPHTLYKNVFCLPGGHWLKFDLLTKKIHQQLYWQFRIEPDFSLIKRSEEDLANELHHLLSEAVRKRLSTDVPLGVFLSGGIDSSSIAVLAAKHLTNQKIKTFAIGFEEPSYDESPYARLMSNIIGSEHHEKIISISTCMDLVFKILGRLDEPIGDPSILPTYLLNEFAHSQVKVALSGDGGDELFAGYDPFKALKLANIYKYVIGRKSHQLLQKFADTLPLSYKNMSFDFKLRKTLTGLSYKQSLWNPIWLGPANPSLLTTIFPQPIDIDEVYSEAIQLWENSDLSTLGDKTLEFYTRLYLQNNILTKIDRASMMASLEARSPFLDREVVEFARKLPYQYKHKGNIQKYLLKKAMAKELPASILNRKKKGFGIPLGKWLQEFPAQVPLQQITNINLMKVQQYWQQHRLKTADHRQFLWCWLALQAHFYPRVGNDKFFN